MICSICLSRRSASTIKTKCCNQRFHVDCVDQWVNQEKFTCPVCRNEDEFMASLPFQKFKLTNAQGSVPQGHLFNMAMRKAISETLDIMMKHQFRFFFKRPQKIGGILFVRVKGTTERPLSRPLKSNTGPGFGFFFSYKEGRVWIHASYHATPNNEFVVALDE